MRPQYVTAETLTHAVDFHSPFTITTDADGRHIVTDAPGDLYAPDVEHDERHDVLIDGQPYEDAYYAPGGAWTALVGHSGQHGYSGPTMHASETLSGGLARRILADAPAPGDDPHYAYALAPVEVRECDDSCTDHTPEEYAEGTADHEPAGWVTLRRRIA